MDPQHVVILVAAGSAGGFIAGLVGVGGGIIFAPVLFFYFEATGVPPDIVAPVTIATSLLCTLTASTMSAWQHHMKGSVRWGIALRVGAMSTIALYVVVRFVTTQPWYDDIAFKIVFGSLLLIVALRMFMDDDTEEIDDQYHRSDTQESLPVLGGIGCAAGTIAALAGVGGGIVMVPAYHEILRLRMRDSVGTSSGAIVLISLIGVAAYGISGWSNVSGLLTLGYVDVVDGLVLAVPALAGAKAGAAVAHRLPLRTLRITFALLAIGVAARMLFSALFASY